MPQVSSSRIDVLTFDRATLKVSAISSAGSARGDRYSKAWICATVRLIPHRVPISPQCKMYCFCTPVKVDISLLSVQTESPEYSLQVNLRTISARRRRNPPESPMGLLATSPNCPSAQVTSEQVMFGDPVLSNFLDRLRSLTGGTHFATFYQTFIESLAE